MSRRQTSLPRRARLFDDRHLPTWMVAQDNWQRIYEIRVLPPGTDLMREFIQELLRYHDTGWRLSDFSAFSAYFFAEKEREHKRMIYITVEDPRTKEIRASNR